MHKTWWVVIILGLSGCLGAPDPASEPSAWDGFFGGLDVTTPSALPATFAASSPASTPVIAVLDTGVNALHGAFLRGQLPALGAHIVEQRSGLAPLAIPAARVAAVDDGFWLEGLLQSETLYYFEGTQLLFYSLTGGETLEALDPDGHGTATAFAAATSAPDALVVAVQFDGSLSEPLAWVAEQDWIDVVSVSYGCPANCAWAYPTTVVAPSEVAPLTESLWESGKLLVNSAGNDPTPTLTDPQDSPPWVISVGGADGARHGETLVTAKMVDVVANMSLDAPAAGGLDDWRRTHGSSFAAPVVAGTLAQSLAQIRQATGHVGGMQDGNLVSGNLVLSNADLRDALNRSAAYWGSQDYQPGRPEGDPGEMLRDAVATSVPVAPVPWVQMGWGYVEPALASQLARDVIHDTLPEKPAEAHEYMRHKQALRGVLWGSS